jgi:hypothetical protein
MRMKSLVARVRVASVLLFLSCATIQEPPGGPRDFTPPKLVEVTPDSGAIVPGLKNPAVFQFDEVIAERPGVPLDQMVLLSPRPKSLDVSWHRSSFSVKPKDGWKEGVVYRLTLLPGITDLRNNKQPKGRTLVFSTGGQIPLTTIEGRVIDWEAGAAGARALVEAVRVPDSLVYWDVADSVGKFSMAAVPPGKYVLYAGIDKNNNRKRDSNEPFDSSSITLDSTVSRTLWTFAHDTIGPRMRAVTRTDSVTLRAEFSQSLKPNSLDSSSFTVLQLPDSSPVRIAAVFTQGQYDSIQAAERDRKADSAKAKADSAKAKGARPSAPAQPTNQPAPTGAAGAGAAPAGAAPPGQAQPQPSVPRPPSPSIGFQPPKQAVRTGPPVDSAVIKLLKDRPKLSSSAIFRTGTPMPPGGRYVIRAHVANVLGVLAESQQVLVIPALPDTTKKAKPSGR